MPVDFWIRDPRERDVSPRVMRSYLYMTRVWIGRILLHELLGLTNLLESHLAWWNHGLGLMITL